MAPYEFTHEEMIRVQIGKGISNGWDDIAVLDPDCEPIRECLGEDERCVASFCAGSSTCYLTDIRLLTPHEGSMRRTPYGVIQQCHYFTDVEGDRQDAIAGKRDRRLILHTSDGSKLVLQGLGGTITGLGGLFDWMITEREKDA